MEEDDRRQNIDTKALESKAEVNSFHYWQYCVTCGTMLENRKCKLICPKCGFYHSCSEP